MQLEFLIPLFPFPYILRLWGRRKVHNPPTPFPMHQNSLFTSLPPISSHSSTFSDKEEPFALCDPQSTLHRGISPSRRGSTLGFSCPPLLFLVLFFLGGVWVIEQPWAFGDLLTIYFSSFIYKNTKHSIPDNQKSHLPTEHY